MMPHFWCPFHFFMLRLGLGPITAVLDVLRVSVAADQPAVVQVDLQVVAHLLHGEQAAAVADAEGEVIVEAGVVVEEEAVVEEGAVVEVGGVEGSL